MRNSCYLTIWSEKKEKLGEQSNGNTHFRIKFFIMWKSLLFRRVQLSRLRRENWKRAEVKTLLQCHLLSDNIYYNYKFKRIIIINSSSTRRAMNLFNNNNTQNRITTPMMTRSSANQSQPSSQNQPAGEPRT